MGCEWKRFAEACREAWPDRVTFAREPCCCEGGGSELFVTFEDTRAVGGVQLREAVGAFLLCDFHAGQAAQVIDAMGQPALLLPDQGGGEEGS